MSPSSPTWFVTSFYRFQTLENPESLAPEWESQAQALAVRGLVILGAEGFNVTCCALSREGLESFKTWVKERFEAAELFFKDSISPVAPFPRFRVKIREEIVTLETPELVPGTENHRHLSPAEWDQVLKSEKDVVLLDTRNWYETRIGTFKNAVDPKIEQFSDFPKFVEAQKFPPDQKMLIFCTGGIRCEKAILELERRGYDNVYQLEGGILNYLEKFPQQEFEGECFVFDNRVALRQDLSPTVTYGLCPHCGQPAEKKITCLRCDSEAQICVSCVELPAGKVCSKNCAHHFAENPEKKGKPQIRKTESP